jgi:hypothetical protein
MRAALAILILLAARAGAAPLDAKAIAKHAVACGDGFIDLDALGEIVRAEPIGHRPIREAVQLFGKKARAYVFLIPGEHCHVLPVAGKPH